MAVPIVRPTLGGDLMPREIVADIFSKAERQSVIQQIAQRQPLSSTGAVIPVVTGTPSAGWVSEAGRKPVSDMTLGSKLLEPKKLAVIVPFSKEYLRDTSIDLLGILRPKIAEAFAISFDAAAIKGTSTPFAGNLYQTTNTVEAGTTTPANGGLHQDLVNALGTVADEGKSYRVTDWVFDDTFETRILGARDAQGNATFLSSATNDGGPVGRILGRPVRYTNQATTGATAPQNRGFGVDATQIAYGVSQDIQYDISNQASIVLADTSVLHLWQNNLVALLAETELAFVMNDAQAAVRITDATAG